MSKMAEVFEWNNFHWTFGSKNVLTNLYLILGVNVPSEHASFVLAASAFALVISVSQMKKILAEILLLDRKG